MSDGSPFGPDAYINRKLRGEEAPEQASPDGCASEADDIVPGCVEHVPDSYPKSTLSLVKQ